VESIYVFTPHTRTFAYVNYYLRNYKTKLKCGPVRKLYFDHLQLQLTPFPQGHKGLQKKLQIYSFPFRISSVGMAKVTGQTLTKTQMHN